MSNFMFWTGGGTLIWAGVALYFFLKKMFKKEYDVAYPYLFIFTAQLIAVVCWFCIQN